MTDPGREDFAAIDDDLDERIWGPAPTGDQIDSAIRESKRLQAQAHSEVCAMSLSVDEAADLLEVHPMGVIDRIGSGQLVGVRSGNEWLLPRWQFHSHSSDQVVPSIELVQRVFPGDAVALSVWMVRPSVDLDGRSPCDELAHGDAARVVALIRALTSAGR